jgi:hypothetical protein
MSCPLASTSSARPAVRAGQQVAVVREQPKASGLLLHLLELTKEGRAPLDERVGHDLEVTRRARSCGARLLGLPALRGSPLRRLHGRGSLGGHSPRTLNARSPGFISKATRQPG